MKGLLISILVIFIVVISGNAQNKSFHLNDTSVRNQQETFISKIKPAKTFQNAKRYRQLSINPLVQNAKAVQVNDTLVLDLFNNAQYKACIRSVNVDIKGTISISAKIIGLNFSYFHISTYSGKSFITLDLPEKNELYLSQYNHQTQQYYLLEIDPSKQEVLEGAETLIPSDIDVLKKDFSLNITEKTTTNTPLYETLNAKSKLLNEAAVRDTITLLMVYTPAAALWAASHESNINNTISSIMAKSQFVLDNSNSLITLKLVESAQVAYTEFNSGWDLDNLTNPTDGFMDEVHNLRDIYCADIVVLLEDISYAGGQSWLLDNTSGLPANAFMLLRVQQASYTYSGIHEMGHLLGCGHHKLQILQEGPGLFPYSAGWRWTGDDDRNYCSVMTYEQGYYFRDGIYHTRVGYFSSPELQYQGKLAGDVLGGDNARTIRETKSVVAAYRAGCYCTAPEIQASSFNSSNIETNSMTVGWSRGSGTSVLVLARRGTGVNAYPLEGVVYTANAIFGNGPQIGTGNFVVYNGTGTSVDVTGLAPETAYNFAVFEYNSSSNCYNCLPLKGYAVTNSSLIHTACDTLKNILPTDSLQAYSLNPNGFGCLSGHNFYGYNLFAEHYTNITGSSLTGLNIYVEKAISGGTGGNHKVTFNVFAGGGIKPGIILASKDVAVNQLMPDSYNFVQFDSPVPMNCTEVYVGFQVYYNTPSDTFSVMQARTRPDLKNSGFLKDHSYWYTYPEKTYNQLYSSLCIYPVFCDNCQIPAAAGILIGATDVCQEHGIENYSIPAIPGADSYGWTLPEGVTGTSTTNSIDLTFSRSAIPGNIRVKGQNACGEGQVSTMFVAVKTKPTTPFITLMGEVLQSDVPTNNQWCDQNGSITGANNQFYAPSAPGEYYVVVSRDGCSSDPSNIIKFFVTEVSLPEINKSLKVYPNPFSNELVIEMEGNTNRVYFEILNSIGQIVFAGNLNQRKVLDANDLSRGVYVLKLHYNKTVEFRKIIKE